MAAYNHCGAVVENKTMSIETPLATHQSFGEEDAGDTYHETIKGHTKNDRADMSRMGKIQELRVHPNHPLRPRTR
jgi:hypothetical protein